MDGLYRALMTHRTHQDRLMWSRVQTLSALQVAAFACSWAIRDAHWFAAAVMVVAILLTWLIYGLVWKDGEDSKVNQDLMDSLAKQLLSKPEISLPTEIDKDLPIRFSSPKKIPALKSGARIILFAFIAFSVIDFGMFLIFGFFPCWLAG